MNDIIAAERQQGSTLFLTAIAVFQESTRPSLSPRYMYSRDLDLCPSVCYDVVFPGGTNSATFVEAWRWGSTIGIEQAFILFCMRHTFRSIWFYCVCNQGIEARVWMHHGN